MGVEWDALHEELAVRNDKNRQVFISWHRTYKYKKKSNYSWIWIFCYAKKLCWARTNNSHSRRGDGGSGESYLTTKIIDLFARVKTDVNPDEDGDVFAGDVVVSRKRTWLHLRMNWWLCIWNRVTNTFLAIDALVDAIGSDFKRVTSNETGFKQCSKWTQSPSTSYLRRCIREPIVNDTIWECLIAILTACLPLNPRIQIHWTIECH